MKILYIIRDTKGQGTGTRFKKWAVGRLDGQDGFFEAALHRAGRVTRRSWAEAQAMPEARRRGFDAIVVNAKSGPVYRDPDLAKEVCNWASVPVALFLGHARADVMPCDAVLDPFHAVFKREPWVDLDRYAIRPANAQKLRPTHLANPLTWLSYRLGREAMAPGQMGWTTKPTYDVFFLGKIQATQNLRREDSWARVRSEAFDARGGLYARDGTAVPQALRGHHLERRAYLRALLEARVTLGLEGIGSFTFRHLEALWAGGFLLSNPTVAEQRLRAPLVVGQDYETFRDHDDMVEKIRYFSDPANDAARREIAQNGRRAYERLYDVAAHALEIRAALAS